MLFDMSWTIKVTEVSSFVSSVDCEEKKMESITSSKLLGNAWHIKLSTDQTILDVITKIFGLVATALDALTKFTRVNEIIRAKTADNIARMIIVLVFGAQCSYRLVLGAWCSYYWCLVFLVFGTWCLVLILLELGAKSPRSLTATEWLMALCSWSSSPLPSLGASLPPPSPSPTCS